MTSHENNLLLAQENGMPNSLYETCPAIVWFQQVYLVEGIGRYLLVGKFQCIPFWFAHLTIIWLFSQAAEQIKLLYELFLKVDATQVEINPFGETPDGKGILYHPMLITVQHTVQRWIKSSWIPGLVSQNCEFSCNILTAGVTKQELVESQPLVCSSLV